MTANQPEQPLVPDALHEPPHQHVVVHAVEEPLQVHVHHEATTFVHVALRLRDRVVGAASRPKALAVRRKARVESRPEHLQDGLLDEPIDDGRDAELSLASARLRDRVPSHRRRLVRAREQSLAQRGPMRLQVLRQLIHRHPVDAGAAPVLPRPLQRGLKVRALAHALHEVARSRALVSVRRRRRFRAPLCSRDFVPTP
jgi:hypothetical protein